MRRTVGLLLLTFGLAHAGAGMWLVAPASAWFGTVFWRLAIAAFLAAGTGLMGIQWLNRHWRALANVGALASLVLIAMSWQPGLMIVAAIDGAILLDALPFVHRTVARSLQIPEHPPRRQLTMHIAQRDNVGLFGESQDSGEALDLLTADTADKR